MIAHTGDRVLAGVISRADEEAHQTTVIDWRAVEPVFGDGAVEIGAGGEGLWRQVPLAFPVMEPDGFR